MKKDVAVNTYIHNRNGEEIIENIEMLEEAKKDLRTQYNSGAITEEQYQDGLKELEKQYPLTPETLESATSIVCGYKKNKAYVEYDGVEYDDLTEEFSSNVYIEANKKQMSKEEKKYLEKMKKDMDKYIETCDETILEKYSEEIASAIVDLVNIGGYSDELHEFLAERGISLKEEVPTPSGR